MTKGFRTLMAYQKAFALAMRIFELSKFFPSEEKYSLTLVRLIDDGDILSIFKVSWQTVIERILKHRFDLILL